MASPPRPAFESRPGTFGIEEGRAEASCEPCPAGSFTQDLGQLECAACPEGGVCREAGAATAMAWVPCPKGTYNPPLAMFYVAGLTSV